MVVFTIARNEIRRLVRDKVVLVLGLVMLSLLAVSVISGAGYYKVMAEQHEQAQELARIQWENQGEKNPHSAAHYGTFAFKPVTVLSVFEPGVDRYTGVSLFMEAHRQNFATYSLAEDKDASMRFAELTPAFIFGYLFPLFIIFVGYRSIAAEKESGMYRFLVSQGVSVKQLITGKAIALWGIIALLFAPFFIVGLSVLILTEPAGNDLLRFFGMNGVWLLYFGVMAHVTLGVSALSKSSGSAMVFLLAFWMISTLLVPKLVTNFAAQIHPVPNTSELYQRIQADLRGGIDGHNPYSEHSAAFRDSVLAAHGVEDVADLPFNFSGLMLQESEEFEKKIYDYHLAKIEEIHQRQIQLFAASSVLSPTIATRLASMTTAGTDIHAFSHFTQAAEAYRIQLMRDLNMDLKVHAVGDRASGYAVGSDFFAENIAFTYQRPNELIISAGQRISLLVTIVWFMASLLFLMIVSSKREEL
ncbi:MAG: DUF3526 domain-containing protein [Balneolia bacterium]|nr:DUF3526 domain-containing protein [Balneolia bacterium]